MNMEQRLEEILTELACRSADVPRNMLPVPFDGELILDFGEEVVKDLKSKKEILKFERSWIEMVEEEEVRQRNLLKMELELKAMAPQIKLKEKMQEELMKEAPKKIVKLRQTFLAIEKSRKYWKTIHEELKVVLVKRVQQKIEFHHQKKIMLEVLKEIEVVASKEIKKRSEREERRNTIQKEMHQELMAVLTRKNMERIQNMKQKETMALMLKELKVVALRELKSRNEREVRRETIWKAIHKELMKFNKGTNPEDEEEDLFVPRKLFMFKVDTFKNSPQNVETTQ
ncbi:myosin-11-like [Saccostrea cucullata]|uniref:myosin-11-like n=1 Tax=Saccostrea cuccullata TaxID=36930 RepID=UPI002ED0E433